MASHSPPSQAVAGMSTGAGVCAKQPLSRGLRTVFPNLITTYSSLFLGNCFKDST